MLPQPGFLERLRELATKHGTVLIFDEVITGFRHALGGYQSIAGVTPDLTTMGKAMGNGWPVSALGGKAELMELFSTTPGRPAFFAGTFNGHPPTSAAALATIDKLEREPVHEHVFALGERTRQGLTRAVRAARRAGRRQRLRLGLRHATSSTARSRRYDDLLANDVELFIGYRRELMKHGIFELPLNLKRSHFSYAHTDADVDRLLEATEAAVTPVPGVRGLSHPVTCTIDLSADGKQAGELRASEGTPADGEFSLDPGRDDRERRRADGARLGRHPRRRVRGPDRRASARRGDRAGAGVRPDHRHPGDLDRGVAGALALLAVRRELQPLLPRTPRRAARRGARATSSRPFSSPSST